MPDGGGGLPAYRARDRLAADALHLALMVSRDASPRGNAIRALTEPIDNLMTPVGQGVAPLAAANGEKFFIVCTPPPGPPVSAGLNVWPEKALLDLVLRPIARVLGVLNDRNLTHRAIRPNNVFQSAPGQPVTLGAAWAAPPAMHQPAVFEAPYTALCHPSGRGEGSIADDVYALGVLLITLAGGTIPLAQFDDLTAIRWKLDLGSFAALTRDVSLSGSFADLLRGMLAEDPDHRPTPVSLLDSAKSRSRRIAARPAKRSQRPLFLNDVAVSDARSLAFAMFLDEKKAVQFLRNGLVAQWLRRGLGDSGLASRIEDLVRARLNDTRSARRADPSLVMHTIATLDSNMPLCWHGLALWPDSVPALLAHGFANGGEALSIAEELLVEDIPGEWSRAEEHSDPSDSFRANADLHQRRQLLRTGGMGGLLRLFYSLNPDLPCRAQSMTTAWVATPHDLMAFLEKTVAGTGDTIVDMNIAAFIAARADRKVEMQVDALLRAKDGEALRRGELALLQQLQVRYHPGPMPGLAAWAAARLRPDLDRWHNRPRRAALHARLDVLVQAGHLSRMLALIDDLAARSIDASGVQRASVEIATIDAEVAAIEAGDEARLAEAKLFGQAITGGVGISAFILTLLTALLR